MAAADWGRRSAGASLRLSGLGEVVRGVPCGRQTVCLESDLQPGNFLVAWQEGRMVWQRQPSSSQCGHVRLSVSSDLINVRVSAVLRPLHCRPLSRGHIREVSDPAGPRPRPRPPLHSQPPRGVRQVPGLVLDWGLLVRYSTRNTDHHCHSIIIQVWTSLILLDCVITHNNSLVVIQDSDTDSDIKIQFNGIKLQTQLPLNLLLRWRCHLHKGFLLQKLFSD